MTAHWARAFIGKQWSADGDGPESFSCLNLVRHAFSARRGVELPAVAVDVLDDARAIRQTGFRPLSQRQQLEPVDGDVVLMRGAGQLHCGLVVVANGRIGILHSAHYCGVVWQLWRDAVSGMRVEIWRRA